MAWIDVTGSGFWTITQNATWSGDDAVWDGSGYIVLTENGAWADQLRPQNVRITYTASHTESPASGNWQVEDVVAYIGQTANGFTAGSNIETIPCNLGWYEDLLRVVIPEPGSGHTLTITKIEYEEAAESIYDYIYRYTVTPTYRMVYNRTYPGFFFNESYRWQTIAFYEYPPNAIWLDTDNPPNHLRVILELATADTITRNFRLTYQADSSNEIVFEQIVPILDAGIHVLEFDFDQIPTGYYFSELTMLATDNVTYLQTFKLLTVTMSYVEPPPPDAVEIPAYVDRYQFKMTGSPELILPMSSFSARLISGTDSYLQVVLPGATEYIDEIEARSAEDLVVTWQQVNPVSGAVISSYEIVTVNFENLSVARGANSESLTLTGHKQKTYSTPKAAALTGKYIENGDSDTFAFIPNVYPQDTFGALTIATLTINVNTQSTTMTVTYE